MTIENSVDAQPRLWNPVAAVRWSLVFTPAFGALLHAANWRTVGKNRPALANMWWAGLSAVVVVLTIFSMWISSLNPFLKSLTVVLVILLVGKLGYQRWQTS